MTSFWLSIAIIVCQWLPDFKQDIVNDDVIDEFKGNWFDFFAEADCQFWIVNVNEFAIVIDIRTTNFVYVHEVEQFVYDVDTDIAGFGEAFAEFEY